MQLSTEPIAQAGRAERRPAGTSTSRREGVLPSKPCTGSCPSHLCSNSALKLAGNSSGNCPTYMLPEITAYTSLCHTSCRIVESRSNTDRYPVQSCFNSHRLAGHIQIIFAHCSPTTSLVLPQSTAQMPSPSSKSKSARRLPTRLRAADAQEEPTGTSLALREAAVAKAKARPATERATGAGSGEASTQARTRQEGDWAQNTDWAQSTGANGWRHWQWSSWTSPTHDWQWEGTAQSHMSQAASSTAARSNSTRPEDHQSISQLHHIEVAKRQLATLPSEEARVIVSFLSSLPPPPESAMASRDEKEPVDEETQTASVFQSIVDSTPCDSNFTSGVCTQTNPIILCDATTQTETEVLATNVPKAERGRPETMVAPLNDPEEGRAQHP